MMKLGWLMLALAATPPAPAPKQAAPAKVAKGKAAKKKDAAPPPPAAAESDDAPEAPPKPFHWDVPGVVDWVESVGPQVSQGVPMDLQMVRSTVPAELLVQHFVDDFEAAGFYLPEDKYQRSPLAEPMLTALDPEKMRSYTVIFQSNPDHTTTLFLGTADLSHYNPGAASQLEWAPMMPGATHLMRTDMEVAQTAMYSVNASEQEVLAFYREALGKHGYQESEPGTFRRGTEVLSVSSHAENGERKVVLNRHTGQPDAEAQAPAP
jgi:hypothetical protein